MWLDQSGYYDYENPYDDARSAPKPVEPGTPEAKEEAEQHFAVARDSFRSRGYAKAATEINKAARRMPDELEYKEFRALANFAQQRYKVAAASLHPVLSAGPGWDWTTMIGLYGKKSSYETHLRLLEKHLKKNPGDAAARFVLSYHYLTAGHTEAARKQLESLSKLTPDDRVTTSLLAMVSATPEGEGTGKGKNSDEVAKDEPLPDTFQPVGTWTGKPKQGGEVVFILTSDEKFTWRYTVDTATKEFEGNYTLVDDRILLEDLDIGGLVLRIHPDGANAFVLTAEDRPEEEPGVRFERVK